jgi:HNH endonuclease
MPAPNPIKTCPGCTDTVVRATLPIEQQCSSCRKKERNRIWRGANPGAMATNAKRWRDAGNKSERPEGYAEERRQYANAKYHNDPKVRERTKAAAAKRRAEKPEEVKAALKAWVEKNRDKVRLYNRDYARAWYATTEGKARQKVMRKKFRDRRLLSSAARNARRYAEHGMLDAQFLNWLHKWQDHCCAYCNVPLAGKETIEHIVPLNGDGTNLPHNVVLTCLSCNSSKQDTSLDTWRPMNMHSIPRMHSQYYTSIAVKLLEEANIPTLQESDYILLPNSRKLFILSSFWMSERLGSRLSDMQTLAANHPGAVFSFDHEWKSKPEAMVNIIAAKAGVSTGAIGARELTVDMPSLDDARAFMNRWHLQGFAPGAFYCGLRESNGTWRAICSVSESSKSRPAILGRMAFQGHVAGGFSRLVKAAKSLLPDDAMLMTYADIRFGDGRGYLNAGFMDQGTTQPSFHYVNATGMYHWNAYTKTAMARKLDFFDFDWPAWRLAKANGLWRLDDLPLRRFVLQP